MSDTELVAGPMTAVVEFRIPPDQMSTDDWLAIWRDRADDALNHEPATSGFEAAINLEDETSILVYERYVNGDEGLRVHCERPSHAAIGAALQQHNLTMERTFAAKFADIQGYGWWSRPEQAAIMNNPGVVLVLLGMNFTDLQSRDKFIELSANHADYCLGAEPDTLIYSGGLSKADSTFAIDKEADLVFVMACTDMAAVEKHRDDPNHLALGTKFSEAGAVPEVAFRRTYRTTGEGFLWHASRG